MGTNCILLPSNDTRRALQRDCLELERICEQRIVAKPRLNYKKDGIGYRHIHVLFSTLGLLLSYSIRSNLSVAVVAMTSNTTNPAFKTVDWDTAQKGTLSGMFFYGYFVANIPAGILVNKFSPKVVISVAAMLSSLLNMVFPYIVMYIGFEACCVLRVVLGFLQGTFVPGLYSILAKWCPPDERGPLYSYTQSGNAFGVTLMLSTSGYVASSISLGWPAIFYLSGGALTLWSVLFYIFVVDSPAKHKRISPEERNYIENSINSKTQNSQKLTIPWLSIFGNVPVWALICGGFSFLWGYWTLQTLLPTFMQGVLHFDMSQNGLISALPSLGMALAAITFPFIDRAISRYFNWSLLVHRKFWNSIAVYSGTIAFAVLAFIPPERTTVVTILIVATTLSAGVHGGYGCNVLDLTTNFTGATSGVTNGLTNLASLLAPTITGYMISDEKSVEDWQRVFLLGAIVYFIGNTVYIFFASASMQDWNDPKNNDN